MAFGQAVAGLGGVSGTVRDASGAVVADATVVVANEAKGIKRTLQTTDAGVFSAPALVPSSGYTLKISQTGFSDADIKEFEILVGQIRDFSVVLQVKSVTEEVLVTTDAPLVEQTKTGVSQVVEQAQIDNLPINGRRADTFVLLTPAVVADGTFGLVSFRGVASGNSFLTDGNDTTNSFYNENAGRTRISTQISQDAVQEFQVLADGFSPEFGRALGGVINTVTRSGSNNYHGTAYWYFRNRTLNAADRYANRYTAPEWRHQAGGSMGGPIIGNKLFFFSNFEMVKRNFPGLNRIINSNFAPSGVMNASSCVAAAAGPTAAQCAAAVAFIRSQMEVLVPRTVDSAMGFGKIDWRPGERNSFSFDANLMHWRSPYGIQTQSVLTGGNMLGNNGHSTVETRYGKASWTSIPTMSSVNELRFGWFKDRLSDPAASDLWPSTGPLYITVNNATVGAAQAYPRTYPSEQRFQLVDNYSWTRGAHSMKFGVDWSTTEDYLNQLYNANGGYSYTNITNFAKDFSGNADGVKSYSTFTQQFGNAVARLRTSDINLYANDTWKIAPKLTLNYGLRYEKTFIPQPTLQDANYAQTGRIPQDNNNFAPRVSLAYSPDSKTVVRAGYGIYFARIHGNGLSTLIVTGNARYQTAISVNNNQTGAPTFPNVVSTASSVPAGTVSLYFADENFRTPYTQQGTLAVERELADNLGLTVSYLWSRGVQLWTIRDLNLAPAVASATYRINDSSGNAASWFTTPIYTGKIDSRYGRIYQVENGGQSWYNGLAVQLRKRMSHGFSGSLAYTWSHAIDNARQTGASDVIGWTQAGTYNGDYGGDRGSSSLDQRHRAVVSFMWEPRLTTSATAAARYLVNGWQLSAITTLASSQPVSPTISVSGQQFSTAGIAMAYTTSVNGSGLWNRAPFLPVGYLDVDRTYRVDARLSRELPFTERIRAYLMFEAFNAFNTQYNTAINAQAFTASGGVLTPVATVGNGSSSQGFPDGTNARRMQAALRLVF